MEKEGGPAASCQQVAGGPIAAASNAGVRSQTRCVQTAAPRLWVRESLDLLLYARRTWAGPEPEASVAV